nr:hypothetical protein [Methanobrevibacter arboriphilus]
MITIKKTTKVSLVSPKYSSFRTSFPKEVADALGIEDGDKINWVIIPIDNELKVSVEKAE